MRVFADAFFYIAFINSRDEYHAQVMKWAAEFTGEIVTTQWVLAEVADALAASTMRRRVKQIFTTLAADGGTAILEVSPDQFNRGLDLYDQRPDKGWSLTDCISFTVMNDAGLTVALTGDHHFSQAGFSPVFKLAAEQ